MSLDPVTLARLWMVIRPIKRLKERRQAKRARQGLPVETVEVPMTNEIVLLVLRHGLTFLGGAGMFTDNELAQLSAAGATLVGLVWSGYRKWKRAKPETP